MYNHLLDTFVVVAENNSLSKASQELYMSVPAIKKQIDELENHLGAKLFYRNYKGVFLTNEGKIIYDNLPRLKELSKEILSKVTVIPKDKIVINVGTFYMNTAKDFLKKWYKHGELTNRYILQVKDLEKKIQNIESLFDNDLDIIYGVYDAQFANEKYGFLKIKEINPIIAIPQTNKLSCKNKITVSDLKNEEILILRTGISEYGDRLRELIKNYNSRIKINDLSLKDSTFFSSDGIKNCLIFSSYYWGMINPSYEVAEFESDVKLKVGIIYKKDNNKKIKKLIGDIKKYLNIKD